MITLTICCAVLPHSYPIGWILRIVGLIGKVSWVASQARIEAYVIELIHPVLSGRCLVSAQLFLL